MRITDRPVAFKRADYEEALQHIVGALRTDPAVSSILRFGNITTPGISDLDVMVVVKQGAKTTATGFEGFPERFKGLFTHGIMGVCEDSFHRNHRLNDWSDYHVLHGTLPSEPPSPVINPQQLVALQRQIALEFLLINCIDIAIQKEYGVIKLRSYLQHVKGIRYDLKLLGITDHWLYPMVAELQHWINNWFSDTPNDSTIVAYFKKFERALFTFTAEELAKGDMYLPERASYRIAKNIPLHKASSFFIERAGTILPSLLAGVLGKKHFRILNKFNTFEVGTPFTSHATDPILEDRFRFMSAMKHYNREHLPNLTTLSSGLIYILI